MWVETHAGRTEGNWQYYAEADPRIKGIRDRFREGKVSKEQVIGAVKRITGQRRIDADWKIAVGDNECPPGRDIMSWGRDMFELWVAQQEPKHCRIYGSPEVIARFITEEE
jgi:hypothetical protein